MNTDKFAINGYNSEAPDNCPQDFKDQCIINNALVKVNMLGIKEIDNLYPQAIELVDKFTSEGRQVIDYQLIIKTNPEYDYVNNTKIIPKTDGSSNGIIFYPAEDSISHKTHISQLTIGYKMSVIDYKGHTNQYGDYITVNSLDFKTEPIVPIAKTRRCLVINKEGSHVKSFHEDDFAEFVVSEKNNDPTTVVELDGVEY